MERSFTLFFLLRKNFGCKAIFWFWPLKNKKNLFKIFFETSLQKCLKRVSVISFCLMFQNCLRKNRDKFQFTNSVIFCFHLNFLGDGKTWKISFERRIISISFFTFFGFFVVVVEKYIENFCTKIRNTEEIWKIQNPGLHLLNFFFQRKASVKNLFWKQRKTWFHISWEIMKNFDFQKSIK